MHLNRLQQGNHEELRLIAEIPGERSLEEKVQADLKAFERGGKWFHANDEVLDYIEKIQSDDNETDVYERSEYHLC